MTVHGRNLPLRELPRAGVACLQRRVGRRILGREAGTARGAGHVIPTGAGMQPAFSRRSLLKTIVLAGAVAAACPAAAQTYPSRPVRFLVPFAAGGGVDISSRIITQRLAETAGYTAVVDNRAGGNGNVGADLVAKGPADGYTVLMSAVTLQVINVALYPKLPYDLIRDFAPITLTTWAPLFLVTHPSLPVRTVKEFVALAKSQPGKLNYGSSGTGSSLHLAGVMFDRAVGIKTNHVPYRGGGPAVVDLAGGQIEFAFSLLGVFQQFAEAGKLRNIGVAALQRYPDLPKIPTLAEQGVPGFEAETVYGVLVPAATPKDIQAKLHADLTRALGAPEVRKKLGEQGMAVQPTSQEAFAQYLRNDLAKYSKLVKETGIKVDF
jgi:tripartite-type tricarboxylate transporter receptor subunit TctC